MLGNAVKMYKACTNHSICCAVNYRGGAVRSSVCYKPMPRDDMFVGSRGFSPPRSPRTL